MSPTRQTVSFATLALGLVLAAVACDGDAEATIDPTAPAAAASEAPSATEPPTAEPPTAAPPTAEPTPPATEPPTTTEPSPPTTEPPPAATEAPPPTSEPAPAATEPPDFDLEGIVQGTSVISGPDLLAQLDPDDPAQASNIADITALLDATGAGIDQLTMLNAVSADGQSFVGAMRLDRADIEVARDAYVESMFDNLAEPRVEGSELGGKDVTLVYDDAAPGQPPLVVYASAEIVWLISGPEASAVSVLEKLP